MMAFNLFNTAQLPAGLPPGTPIKAEDSNAEALRFLANGGLLGAAGPMGLPPMPMEGLRAMLPPGLQFPLVYPGLQDFKPELFSAGGGPMPPFFDGLVGFHPYPGLDGSRRKNATRETTAPLKRWLEEHNSNPYPTKGEKLRLAYTANLTLTQVSTWFANARRRLKKENGGNVAIKRRPEDGDDDDDMAELDRPSSSNSAGSDIKEEVDIDAAETENKAGSTTPSEQMTPKKKSILSIDDILNGSKKDDEAGSSKKDSPSSEESAPSWGFNLAQMQQFMSLCRSNPQMMAAMGPRFLPFNPLMMMGAVPTTPTGPLLNGSFTSETTSVSPSSSHSPSAPADEPKSPKTEA